MKRSAPLAMLLSLAGATAFAQEELNPYLEQAKAFYKALEFEKCTQRLEMAPQWKNSRAEMVEIEIYAGLCQYALGKAKDAEERFQLALQIDPDAELPPYTSPKIVELFQTVKRQVQKAREKAERAEKERAEKAEAKVEAKPPPEEKVDPPNEIDKPEKVEKKPEKKVAKADAPVKARLEPKPKAPPVTLEEPSPWKDREVPVALGGLAVLAAGSGAYFGVRAKSLEAEANSAHFESDGVKLGNEARASATMANVAFGIGAAAAASAVATWLLDVKLPSTNGSEPLPEPKPRD